MKETSAKIHEAIKLEHTYMTLPEKFYSVQRPEKVPKPKLVIFNRSLAREMGLDEPFFQSEEGLEVLSGNRVIGETIAQAYAGHQFGYFTMLGDGRAVLVGEYVALDGERYDIQLKGSGRTPYSRRGDGKATLGPMLREYIISEAMHGLGIPTTRSLAVVTTGEIVNRETPLEGAILTRIAKSHIRVGTFQYAAKWGSEAELRALADYTINRHFKEMIVGNQENIYLAWLREVIKRQAELIAKWQLVGFIHGVMNTDNMTISGETIDYGPCAFMDTYDPKTVFSSIDEYGRYAYGNQPIIGGWNLARFAESILPLLDKSRERAVEMANKAVSGFKTEYQSIWQEGMRKKLGLFEAHPEDEAIITQLLELMQKYQADYTNTFLDLTLGKNDTSELFKSLEFKEWFKRWNIRLMKQEQTKEEVEKLMQANNPVVIPRNYRVEEALQNATISKDYTAMEKLLEAVCNPYDYTKLDDFYINVPRHSGCYRTYCGT